MANSQETKMEKHGERQRSKKNKRARESKRERERAAREQERGQERQKPIASDRSAQPYLHDGRAERNRQQGPPIGSRARNCFCLLF